jgi:hypothetical protein
MIDFFFKKKTITVDCFTSNYSAYTLFPIQRSNKFFPSWWKNLQSSYTEKTETGLAIPRPTIKRCEGIINLYQQGFMIPMWCDLIIETANNTIKFVFADQESSIANHGPEQMSREFEQYLHTKLICPWRLREKTGVNFLFLHPSWNHIPSLSNMHIVPGVVEYKYQHTANVNMLLARNKRFNFAAGDPMAHLIPISDKDVDIKLHIVDADELKKMPEGPRTFPFFLSSYRKSKKILDNENP